MTYGELLTRARAHLVDAAAHLAATAIGDEVDVLSLAASRAAVYRHLGRNVALLTRRAPGQVRSRRQASLARDRLVARFREGLRLAADDLHTVPAITDETPTVRSVRAAADCLGAAADILATHLSPQARTPEGAALLAGVGSGPAMVQLATVASRAVTFDQNLSAWLASAGTTSRPLTDWALGEARRGTAGSLSDVIAQLLAAAPAESAVLNRLQAVPDAGAATPDLATAEQALSSLNHIRAWLWQNPDRVHAVHLRLAAEVGLAVHIVARQQTREDQPGARAWRRAATTAEDLDGTRPTDIEATVADRLADLLRWLRTAARRDDVVEVGALLTQLPALATALLAGTDSAVHRHDIFVNRTRLATSHSGIVTRARTVWRPATLVEHEIVGLRTALADAADGQIPHGNRGAGAAFRRPPQPGATPGRPPAELSPAPRRRAAHRRS